MTDHNCDNMTMDIDDKPLTSKSMLKLLNTTEYQSLVLKAVQPILSVYNIRVSNLEHNVANLHKQMSDMVGEIAKLKQTNRTLTSQVTSQQRNLRANNLIVTGLEGDEESIKTQFITLAAEKLQTKINASDISVTMLGQGSSRPRVKVAFTNIWTRNLCYEKRLHLRGTDIYISEDLTKEQNALFYKLRQMKRKREISDTWSKDSRLFVRLLQADEAIEISTLDQLHSLFDTPTPSAVPHPQVITPAVQATTQQQPYATTTNVPLQSPPPYAGQMHLQPVVLPQVQALLAQAAGPPGSTMTTNTPLIPQHTSQVLPATASDMLYQPNPPPPMLPTPVSPTAPAGSTSTNTSSSTETFIGFTQNEIQQADEQVEVKRKQLLKQLEELDRNMSVSTSAISN